MLGDDDGLLSAEESEALLAAMRADPGAVTPHAESLRLGAPDAPLLRAQHRVERASAASCAALREVVIRLAQVAPQVSAQAPETSAWDASSPGRPGEARWALMVGSEPIGAITVGAELASVILDRRLGTPDALLGSGVSGDAEPPPPRNLSTIDRRMLEPVAAALLGALMETRVLEGTPATLVSPSALPDMVIALPVLRVRLDVALGETHADARIELLAAAFAPRQGEKSKKSGPSAMQRAVSGVQLDLVALLGEARGSIRALLALEVGSILKLEQPADRPVTVWAGDVPVMRGMPRVHSGHVALEITEHAAIGRARDGKEAA